MTKPKRSLKIDLNELSLAFDSGLEEASYYLDRETGALLLITDESRHLLEKLWDQLALEEEASLETVLTAIQDLDIPDWQKQEMCDVASVEMDFDGSRYLPVPPQDSREGYRDMEAFIETVTDEHVAELLEVAIDGPGAFRRFKDVLARYPQERERWFRFKEERLRQRVLDWLADKGIAPEDS